MCHHLQHLVHHTAVVAEQTNAEGCLSPDPAAFGFDYGKSQMFVEVKDHRLVNDQTALPKLQ